MSKFIIGALSISLVLLIGIAYFGIYGNRDDKWKQAPEGLRYEIRIAGNKWPDRYYVRTYDTNTKDIYTISFPEGYWIYEPSSKPFGKASWVLKPASTEELNYSIVALQSPEK